MFIVMEVQVFPDGNVSTPCYKFDDRYAAEQKYHAILSSAAVSNLLVHTAFMLTVDGQVIKSETYRHEPEPDPEPVIEDNPEEA